MAQAKHYDALELARHITDPTLRPFVDVIVAEEMARVAESKREAERASGVRFSGMEPSRYVPRTFEQIFKDAQARYQRMLDYSDSPRGRFLASLKALEELGYGREAEQARSAYRRGFADSQQEPNVREIAVALIALNDIAGQDARDARLALEELLLASAPQARAA